MQPIAHGATCTAMYQMCSMKSPSEQTGMHRWSQSRVQAQNALRILQEKGTDRCVWKAIDTLSLTLSPLKVDWAGGASVNLHLQYPQGRFSVWSGKWSRRIKKGTASASHRSVLKSRFSSTIRNINGTTDEQHTQNPLHSSERTD